MGNAATTALVAAADIAGRSARVLDPIRSEEWDQIDTRRDTGAGESDQHLDEERQQRCRDGRVPGTVPPVQVKPCLFGVASDAGASVHERGEHGADDHGERHHQRDDAVDEFGDWRPTERIADLGLSGGGGDEQRQREATREDRSQGTPAQASGSNLLQGVLQVVRYQYHIVLN